MSSAYMTLLFIMVSVYHVVKLSIEKKTRKSDYSKLTMKFCQIVLTIVLCDLESCAPFASWECVRTWPNRATCRLPCIFWSGKTDTDFDSCEGFCKLHSLGTGDRRVGWRWCDGRNPENDEWWFDLYWGRVGRVHSKGWTQFLVEENGDSTIPLREKGYTVCTMRDCIIETV